MKRSTKFVAVLTLSFLMLTAAGSAWANGDMFFASNGKAFLYYFGHVKDTHGKVLDNVTINVTVKDTSMKLAIRNDTPGHYRTPDLWKEAMERDPRFVQKILNADNITVSVTKPGYRQVSPQTTNAPRNPSKAVAVPIEFVMEPITETK